MNCRLARSLFSARVDGELTSSEDRELQLHLDRCPHGCAERWASFEATVRLVHDLPSIEPDPSFVGQVLDRVRGYEAERRRSSFAPRRSPAARWRGWISEWAGSIPVPARFASVGAAGLVLGFVLASGIDWRPFASAPSTLASSARETVSGPAVRSRSAVTPPAAQPPRLFGDLIDDLDGTEETRAGEDTVAPIPRRSLPDGVPSVQVVKGDERPQIIF